MTPTRVLFITQEDPFYVRLFFEEYLAIHPANQVPVAIAIAPAMGKTSVWALATQMLEFYGIANFVRVGVRFVMYKLGARIGWGGRPGRFLSIAQVCRHYGVPVLRPRDVNSSDFVAEVRRLEADLIASVAAPQIFKPPLISTPRLGCINIHNSRLPKYRGMLPNFWQLYHGESVSGVTVHRINAALDDGAIILQRDNTIEPGETLHSLIVKTKRAGARVMIDAIDSLASGTAQEVENSREHATHFTFPTRADVREFRRRGHRLL